MHTRRSCSGFFLTVTLFIANNWIDGVKGQQTTNSYPMIMHCHPTAVQIGTNSEHEVSARYNVHGATQVFVSGDGVAGKVINDDNPSEKSADYFFASLYPRLFLLSRYLKQRFGDPANDEGARNDIFASKCLLRFHVAEDAIPGVRDFRIMTPHGVSTLGQIVLVRDPVVVESPNNDSIPLAQPVQLPATLCGFIDRAEDVDYFQFSAQAGSRYVFHVRAQRLLNRLHDMQVRIDPMITLRHPSGTILAASDNHFAGDPLLAYEFEQSGTYYLEIRDVRYQGNPDWGYVIEAHDRPFVTQMYPLALKNEQDSTVELIGWNLPNPTFATVCAKTNGNEVWELAVTHWKGLALNEVPVVVTDQAIQTEPMPSEQSIAMGRVATDSDDPATRPLLEPHQLETFTFPGVWCGTISEHDQVDRFPFQAKANEKFSFNVVARRALSELDPSVRITNEQGQVLMEVDDATVDRMVVADSIIENWAAPSDGKYFFEIRDLHQRGGREYTYAIQAERATPRFELELDTDKTLLAPGMGSVLYVRALRKNGFTGEIELHVNGLPAGVEAITGRILPDLQDGCILLKARSDAPFGASNIEVTGTSHYMDAEGRTAVLQAKARTFQEYYSPGGGRGNYPVSFHTVSVARPMDIRMIAMTPTEIQLAPGESQRIDVTIERAPDYKGNVTLDLILQHLEQPYGKTLPKGVSVDVANSKTLLSANENSGYITIRADPTAPPVERQLVTLNVHVAINFVMKHTFCGEPLWISVRAPQ